VKLGAGESFREFQNTPGVKNYEIYDAANPNGAAVWSNQLNCKGDKQTFSVNYNKAGRVAVDQVAEPK
jgi:hypothetical protein